MTWLILTYRLCEHREDFDVLTGVQAKTEEEAKAELGGRLIRAENAFFEDHWQQAHPDEAAEITRHIAAVARLARVSAYHKRVLSSQFEGPKD